MGKTTKTPVAVPAAVRTLEIFEAFAAARKPLSLSEISKLAKLPLSSCHSLLRTLEAKGYLYFLHDRDAYPTQRMLDLATQIGKHDPIATRLAPALTALRDKTQESIILGVLQDASVTYLLALDGPQPIRYASQTIGNHRPAHVSSMGKAILAQMSESELDDWIGTRKAAGAAPDRPLTVRQLRRDLEGIRERGYYSHHEESLNTISISVAFHLGQNRMGITVAGPAGRMEKGQRKLIQTLFQTVESFKLRVVAPLTDPAKS